MLKAKVTVKNRTGIHARPAAELTKLAKQFKSRVLLKNGLKMADCASIMSLLAMEAVDGTELEITAEGDDEAAAMDSVVRYIAELNE